MDQLLHGGLAWLLGPQTGTLNVWQMAVRMAIVYFSALILLRVGPRRSLGKSTAFDYLIGIMLGTLISRAVNGNAPLIPTIAAGAALWVFHWIVALMAFRIPRFRKIMEDETLTLVENGQVIERNMRGGLISEKDLDMALRLNGGTENLDSVKRASLERDGEISIVKKHVSPQVLQVNLDHSVSTIRIRIE